MGKTTIISYWETKSPGLKYSDHELGSLEFFREVEYKRYSDEFKYKFLKDVAEFNQFKGKNILEININQYENNI